MDRFAKVGDGVRSGYCGKITWVVVAALVCLLMASADHGGGELTCLVQHWAFSNVLVSCVSSYDSFKFCVLWLFIGDVPRETIHAQG